MPGSEETSKVILVVDDDQVILSFVSALLKKHYTVLAADSGEAALQKSREHKGKIDLLLSNVQMPGMNGLELGTRIHMERPGMHVMLMSGYASGMLLLNQGWHFLHKPFVPAQLLHLVTTILNSPHPDDPDLEDAPGFNEHRD